MKRFILLAAFAVLIIGLSGCGKDDGWRDGTLAINVRERVATKADGHLTPNTGPNSEEGLFSRHVERHRCIPRTKGMGS